MRREVSARSWSRSALTKHVAQFGHVHDEADDSSSFDRRDDSLAAVPHQSRLQVRWIDRKDLGVPITVDLDECGDASISDDRQAIERLLVRINDIWPGGWVPSTPLRTNGRLNVTVFRTVRVVISFFPFVGARPRREVRLMDKDDARSLDDPEGTGPREPRDRHGDRFVVRPNSSPLEKGSVRDGGPNPG
jgi:hypothetical protein